MKTKLIIATLNCLMFFLIGTSGGFGQEKIIKTPELKDKRITIKMTKEPLGKIFRTLIENYDIAIGFEESALDRENDDYDFDVNLFYMLGETTEKTTPNGNGQISVTVDRTWKIKQHWFTVNAENERLEDVLNQIVGQMENYKWEINDEIVNIFPIRDRDERFKKLLELKVINYKFGKNIEIGFIRTFLFKLPEFRQFLDENSLSIFLSRQSNEYRLFRKLDVALDFSNLTFKELLNQITKIKRGGWILRRNKIVRSTSDKEYIDIEI